MVDELYQNKTTRDARFKEFRKEGKRVFKYRVINQRISPRYVRDFTGPEKNDTTLGNTTYKQYFPVLYGVMEKT